MSLTISNVTTASSITSGATLDLTGITAAVGDTLILGCAADNAGTAGVSSTSPTITDPAGNTWARVLETNRSPGNNVADGVTLSVWVSTLGFALSAATISINFSPNTTSKGAVLYKVVPGAGEIVVVSSVGSGVTGSSAAFSSGNVSVDAGQYIFGFTGLVASNVATSDSDATNGSWSTAQTARANTGATSTSISLSAQWKLATASGNQSYDTTFSAARQYALNYLIVYGLVTASGATIAAASSAIDGAATGAAGVSGATLSDMASLLAGAGTGGATASGDTASIAASLISGVATGDSTDAEADGAVVEVTAGLIAGAATGATGLPPVTVIGGAWLPSVRMSVDGRARGSVLAASATLLSGSASGNAVVEGRAALEKRAVVVLIGRACGDATVPAHVIDGDAGLYAARYDNDFLLLAA